MENRNITEVLDEIKTLATIDTDIALSCFYVLFNEDKPFVGISVRFAEIIASCWTNIEVGSKITTTSSNYITIQGYANDVQKNSKFTVDVQRKITDKFGNTLSSEAIVQMTNAASSIAFRNVIFKAIPGALFSGVIKDIKAYILLNLGENSILKDTLDWFEKNQVNSEALEKKLKVDDIYNLSSEKTFLLIGIKNAIEDGDATIQELFNFIPKKRKSKYSFLANDIPEEPESSVQLEKIEKKGRGRPKKIKS